MHKQAQSAQHAASGGRVFLECESALSKRASVAARTLAPARQAAWSSVSPVVGSIAARGGSAVAVSAEVSARPSLPAAAAKASRSAACCGGGSGGGGGIGDWAQARAQAQAGKLRARGCLPLFAAVVLLE